MSFNKSHFESIVLHVLSLTFSVDKDKINLNKPIGNQFIVNLNKINNIKSEIESVIDDLNFSTKRDLTFINPTSIPDEIIIGVMNDYNRIMVY